MKIIGKILYLFKNSPEEFAKQISIENGLGNVSLIAMQIRRQIHEYVLNLLKTVLSIKPSKSCFTVSDKSCPTVPKS